MLSDETAIVPVRSNGPLIVLLGSLVIVFVSEIISRSLLPLLLRDHPLLLVALDAHAHDLLLASVRASAVSIIAVGIASRFLVHLVFYLLGRWYGDQALYWLRRKSHLAVLIATRAKQIFAHFASLAVFLLSDDLICLLAGSIRMAPLRFILLHFSGTALRVAAVVASTRYLHGSLVHAVSFIDSGAVSLTVAFIVLGVGSAAFTMTVHRRHLRELAGVLRSDRSDSIAADGPGAAESPEEAPPETEDP